ncbi:hypothetical protein MYX07_02805 [Patescibacteria group bacterium AH-259-L07]|nr:hypothetical protein [Patescibacteria group bacterium AH-259-L07]
MKTWQLQQKARNLRQKGLLYREIVDELGINRTTLGKWCEDIELTPEQIKSRGGRYANVVKAAKANHLKRQKEIELIQKSAEKEIHSLTNYEFKSAGIALYWAEGDKTQGLGFSNSDPELIQFMIKWFREICNVPDEKIKAYLYLHTGQNEKKIKQFWSEITNIPLNQFNKTIFKQEGSASRKYNEDRYKGTIKIRINDENLRHKILAWIEELQFYLGH